MPISIETRCPLYHYKSLIHSRCGLPKGFLPWSPRRKAMAAKKKRVDCLKSLCLIPTFPLRPLTSGIRARASLFTVYEHFFSSSLYLLSRPSFDPSLSNVSYRLSNPFAFQARHGVFIYCQFNSSTLHGTGLSP